MTARDCLAEKVKQRAENWRSTYRAPIRDLHTSWHCAPPAQGSDSNMGTAARETWHTPHSACHPGRSVAEIRGLLVGRENVVICSSAGADADPSASWPASGPRLKAGVTVRVFFCRSQQTPSAVPDLIRNLHRSCVWPRLKAGAAKRGQWPAFHPGVIPDLIGDPIHLATSVLFGSLGSRAPNSHKATLQTSRPPIKSGMTRRVWLARSTNRQCRPGPDPGSECFTLYVEPHSFAGHV